MPLKQRPFLRVCLITYAHTTVDFYMTLFPPLLALFKDRFGLTLVEASLLPMVVSLFGNIPQPFMGYIGDRSNRVRLAALGVLACGLCVSVIGMLPTAALLAGILILASLGSSLFHPTAGGLVTTSLPGRSNFAMAVFLTGGPLGMAIAPVTGTQVVSRYGLESLWVVIVPCLLAAAVLFRLSMTGARSERTTPPVRINYAFLRTAAMRPLWILYAIAVFRSLVHAACVSFISILGHERMWDISRIGWVLSAYLIAATLGRLAGGYLGDRVAPRRLLGWSCACSTVFYVVFCFTSGPVSLSCFLFAGFIFDLGATTNIVLAQRILPQHASTATGLVMGFAWGISGLMLPVIGLLADRTSMGFALACVSLILLPSAALVAALPGTPDREAAGALSDRQST
ncbi:MAG: MFS transporter [Gemmatimonadota bacterium]|nr:MFS transporter [Gemmatimonadota bacterium]